MNDGAKIVLKIVGIIGGLAIVAGLLFAYMQPKIDAGNNAKRSALLAVRPEDHLIGDTTKAKALLIEYSDMQCPACKAYSTAVTEIVAAHKDTLAFVYRHFPLYPTPHKNSIVAAQATEAAQKQDKFWALLDIMFQKQNEWEFVDDPKTFFIDYAISLKLNIEQFKTDMVSDTTQQRVMLDRKNAADLDLHSTPTFFLNGKQITPNGPDALKQLIEDALK